MTKQELVRCIKEELERQSQLDNYDAPYLYNETDTEEKVATGIDGDLDITALADAILSKAPRCKECDSIATPAWSMFHKKECSIGKPAPFCIGDNDQ